jgi:hypothetical protein
VSQQLEHPLPTGLTLPTDILNTTWSNYLTLDHKTPFCGVPSVDHDSLRFVDRHHPFRGSPSVSWITIRFVDHHHPFRGSSSTIRFVDHHPFRGSPSVDHDSVHCLSITTASSVSLEHFWLIVEYEVLSVLSITICSPFVDHNGFLCLVSTGGS